MQFELEMLGMKKNREYCGLSGFCGGNRVRQLCRLLKVTLLDNLLACVRCVRERERERERENYAEKGGNPFLHMLREWTLT